MPFKIRKLKYIYAIFWFLLLYIIAALIWWFISLNTQNNLMGKISLQQLNTHDINYSKNVFNIQEIQKRKHAQYVGEGITFLLLILLGGAFVFEVIRRQFIQSKQQQNFMMALTHELKTPIAISKLNIETLLKRKLEELQQQRLLHITLQETNRLNTLCNNMLLSSQIESDRYLFTKEKLNLSILVHNCIDEFESRSLDIYFDYNIEPNVNILGDVTLFQIVINNLIDNAIKYSPKKSTIFIDLKKTNNSNILLEIADEGVGVEKNEKIKIFKKFYRIGNEATKAAKGTGLGLFLCQKIVKQHGGKIRIYDNLTKGSIFAITLKEAH